MNFKVGQKVVCVSVSPNSNVCRHVSTVLKKGAVYTIKSISYNSCCGKMLLDVGIKSDADEVKCTCGRIRKKTGNIWEFDASRFAPIIENTSTADIANQIFETCNDVKEIKIPELV